jgi:predicted nucleotidyltransferase
MRVDKNSIIDYLIQVKPLLAKKNISIIGFFGSFARGEATVYSDIDLAVKKDASYLQNHTAYEYFNNIEFIKNMFIKKFHRNVDIFDLDSNSSMKENILKDMIYV